MYAGQQAENDVPFHRDDLSHITPKYFRDLMDFENPFLAVVPPGAAPTARRHRIRLNPSLASASTKPAQENQSSLSERWIHDRNSCPITGQQDIPAELVCVEFGEFFPSDTNWSRTDSLEALEKTLETAYPNMPVDVIVHNAGAFLPRGRVEVMKWLEKVTTDRKRASEELEKRLECIDERYYPQQYLCEAIANDHDFSERCMFGVNMQIKRLDSSNKDVILKQEARVRAGLCGAEAESLGASLNLYQWVWRHYYPSDAPRTSSAEHQAELDQQRRDSIAREFDEMMRGPPSRTRATAPHGLPEQFRLLDDYGRANLNLVEHAPEHIEIVEKCEAIDLPALPSHEAMSLALLAFHCAKKCARVSGDMYDVLAKPGRSQTPPGLFDWIKPQLCDYPTAACEHLEQVVRWKSFIFRVNQHFGISVDKLFRDLQDRSVSPRDAAVGQ